MSPKPRAFATNPYTIAATPRFLETSVRRLYLSKENPVMDGSTHVKCFLKLSKVWLGPF